MKNLKKIPLVFAGWLRYLTGIDDKGQAFQLSPDPMLDTLCPYVKEENLRPILENSEIFGVNLYEVHMADTVIGYFKEMQAGPGAVRKTLEKEVNAHA